LNKPNPNTFRVPLSSPDLTDAERDSLQYAFQTSLAYAEEPVGWLVLRGGYGVGKTHLAAAIANRHLETGREAVFVNQYRFIFDCLP